MNPSLIVSLTASLLASSDSVPKLGATNLVTNPSDMPFANATTADLVLTNSLTLESDRLGRCSLRRRTYPASTSGNETTAPYKPAAPAPIVLCDTPAPIFVACAAFPRAPAPPNIIKRLCPPCPTAPAIHLLDPNSAGAALCLKLISPRNISENFVSVAAWASAYSEVSRAYSAAPSAPRPLNPYSAHFHRPAPMLGVAPRNFRPMSSRAPTS